MKHEILKELHFVQEKGGLFYNEVRYLLIRTETLITFQKAAERDLGAKANQILFESGFVGGELSSKRYREVFSFSNDEIVRFIIGMGSQIGWGRFELEKFDFDQKKLIVKVFHSPFAEAYGPSASGVCHFIRGVLSGMASTVFQKSEILKESSCLATGDPFCRFEII
ncbi:MAG: XylR N-terminal domain-containing protein [Syntrophaceae bacterium]|nr:XylR N-terminal domain-containing protein [Syntrophaceae bacterium]